MQGGPARSDEANPGKHGGCRSHGGAGWLFDFVKQAPDSNSKQIAVEFLDNDWRARAYDYAFRFDHSGSARAVLLKTPIDMESACRVLDSVRPRLHPEETFSSIRSFDDVFTGFDEEGNAVLSNIEPNGRLGVWTRRPGSAGGRIFSVQVSGDTCTAEFAGQWYH